MGENESEKVKVSQRTNLIKFECVCGPVCHWKRIYDNCKLDFGR